MKFALVVALALLLLACGADPGVTGAVADSSADSNVGEIAALCSSDATRPCQICSSGQWLPKPNTTPCDDGQLCTSGDHCAAGQCASGGAKDCDDGTPCTADSCDPLKGCVWLPVAATCTDNNPCTVQEHCDAGECKSQPKFCGDDNPCTNEPCDPKTGACQWISNGQEHCIPNLLQLFPDHGLQFAQTPLALVGAVTSSSGKLTQVDVAGVATAVAADGTYSALVPLQWGSNALQIKAVDSAQGKGQALRGVHYSIQWAPLDGQGAQLTQTAQLQWQPGVIVDFAQVFKVFQVSEQAALFGSGQVGVGLVPLPGQNASSPVDVAAHVTGTVAVGTVAGGTAQTQLGVPLRAACSSVSLPAIGKDAQVQLFISYDLLNALLWAKWRAGGFSGDATEQTKGTLLAIYNAVLLQTPLLPPLLTDCPDPAPRVHFDDVRFDALAHDPKVADPTPKVAVTAWASWDAPLQVACSDGQLRLGVGDAEHIAAEAKTSLVDTDFQANVLGLMAGTVVGPANARIKQKGLLVLPLGDAWAGAKCELVAGGVVVRK